MTGNERLSDNTAYDEFIATTPFPRNLPRIRGGDLFCSDLRSLLDQIECICVQMNQLNQSYDTTSFQMEIEQRLPRFVLEEIFKAKDEEANCHPFPPPEIADIELNPRTPDTIYSSCPSNTRPTSPTNISTEFVVTIPSDEVSSTRERVRGPSPPTKDERPIHHKIQVVTGVTGPQNSNFIHLFFHSPTIARRAARPRVISRARVGSHGQLQHFPMSTQRTGWKKIARQIEGSPVPLNSIRFDSPPKSSAARSVAICETYPMAPLSHSQVIPQPNISQFPSIVLLPQSPAISLAGYSHALPRFQ
ncbi:hypothetical protein niasHT_029818 [Heterodera trifolii]|uniref:Uncharacterized protein n=1 Tax=Heterodera trifolii TaxID=157864 RepID=A0ABD2K312_9BILA